MSKKEEKEEVPGSIEEMFVNRVIETINYFQMEWEMTYAQTIGCLYLIMNGMADQIERANRGEENV